MAKTHGRTELFGDKTLACYPLSAHFHHVKCRAENIKDVDAGSAEYVAGTLLPVTLAYVH